MINETSGMGVNLSKQDQLKFVQKYYHARVTFRSDVERPGAGNGLRRYTRSDEPFQPDIFSCPVHNALAFASLNRGTPKQSFRRLEYAFLDQDNRTRVRRGQAHSILPL
jgi:hypothetical protein